MFVQFELIAITATLTLRSFYFEKNAEMLISLLLIFQFLFYLMIKSCYTLKYYIIYYIII